MYYCSSLYNNIWHYCRPHIEVNKFFFDIWKEKHFCRKFPQSYVRKKHMKVHGKANGHNILILGSSEAGYNPIKTSCLRRRLPFHAFQPAFSWMRSRKFTIKTLLFPSIQKKKKQAGETYTKWQSVHTNILAGVGIGILHRV